jgi:hypothetical protein
MPRVGVSITKSVSFRLATQEFSNVYYYEMLALPDQAAANTMIDNIVTMEKTFHSTSVSFVRGRLWSQIGTPSQNEMIATKALSGTGARTPDAGQDRERAFLLRLRAGNDSRGNPVYFRKFYHACGAFVTANTLPSSSQLAQTSGFSSAERTAQEAMVSGIGDANGSAGTPRICSKNGRLATAGAGWSAHQFLEHHQLGDMWRAG